MGRDHRFDPAADSGGSRVGASPLPPTLCTDLNSLGADGFVGDCGLTAWILARGHDRRGVGELGC